MDTKKLRQKILDLAIRGKLVPQDPNDEPASVLLERIREEKKQMVKEGKLKAKDIKNDTIIFKGEDNLHYEKFQDGTVKCIEDEIPFEVPDGWAWCRLQDLFIICSAKRVLQADWKDEGIPFYRAREIVKLSDNGFVDNELFISEEHYLDLKKNFGVPDAGDIMLSAVGTIGKPYIVQENDTFYYKDASVICLQKIGSYISSEYIRLVLEAPYMQKMMYANSNGTTVDTITISTANQYYVAVPPRSEQSRIVNMANSLLHHTIGIEESKEELIELISVTKDKILDLAIRGKLVPHDSNDEPASVLLEHIRAEKEELIKQGKLKRDKKESIIYKGDDNSYYQTGSSEPIEVPYEIPETWTWSNLKELCNYGVCDNIPPEAIDSDAWILDLEDIEKDTGRIVYRATNAERKTTSTKHSFHKDMILYSKLRPYLNKVVLADADGYCTSEIIPLSFSEIILPRYAQLFLMSPFFVGYANHCSYGMKMPRLGTHDGEMALFAIPPYQEQARIVDMVDKLHANIDKIQESLTM